MKVCLAIGLATVFVALPRDAVAESRAREAEDLHLLDGVLLQATSREDVERFSRMLIDGLRDSPTMRRLIDAIQSDTDPRNAIRIVLGRNQPRVLIDSYSRYLLDLEDLERLPSAHDPDLEKNEITREEQIVHILAERRYAAMLAARPHETDAPMTPQQLFNMAHEIGLAEENGYRAERGQTAVIEATSHAVKDSPGQAVIEYKLADGTSSLIVTSHYGQIDRIVPPFLP